MSLGFPGFVFLRCALEVNELGECCHNTYEVFLYSNSDSSRPNVTGEGQGETEGEAQKRENMKGIGKAGMIPKMAAWLLQTSRLSCFPWAHGFENWECGKRTTVPKHAWTVFHSIIF